jgi:hypothetical protein
MRTAFLINTEIYSADCNRFEELMDAVIRHNYNLWGGRINPIIFFSGETLAEEDWEQLEAVDVDCFKSFGSLPEKLIQQLDVRLQPWNIERIRVPQPDAPINVESYGIVVPPTQDNLKAFRDAKLILFDFTSDCEPMIQRFIHRNFGTYFQWFEPKTNNVRREAWLENLMSKINYERVLISDRATLASALTLLIGTPPGPGYKPPQQFVTPAKLSSIQMAEVWPQTDNVYQVIVGDSPRDLAEFWNGAWWKRTWTAPYAHQLWLPTELAKDTGLHEAVKNWLRFFTHFGNSNAKEVEFLSATVPTAELDVLRLQICNGVGWSPRGRIAQPEISNERKRKAEEILSLRQKVILNDTGSAVRFSASHDEETFSLTKPEILEEGINPDGTWMVDVQIELKSSDSPTLPDQSWWTAPRQNSGGLLSSMFKEAARVNRHGMFSVRVENQGGPYSRRVKPELKIHLPERTRIVPLLIIHPQYRPIFTIDARYTERPPASTIVRVEFSDKGDYLRGLIRVFGGFWNAREFCQRRFWRHMFAKLANYDARNDARLRQDVANLLQKRSHANHGFDHLAGRVLGLVRGRPKHGIALPYSAFKVELDELAKTPIPAPLNYLQGDAIVQHHGIQHLTEAEMNEGLNQLIELNVVRPGAYTRCSFCGIANWYHVDDLKQFVRCPGCGHDQSIGVQQEWSYALNSLAEMSVIQGQLSVMQAFAALASHSLTSFFYAPSLNLFKANSSDIWHEVDVPAVVEGDFTVGEVKGGDRGVTLDDFNELAVIAEGLRAQRAIMFLPHENVTADVMTWLEITKGRLSPQGIKAQIYALPTF